MKNKKILRYALITVGALLVFVIIGKSAGWFGKGFIIKIATEKPAKRTIVETITANGKIQPETEVKISADVSGEIVELYIKEGQEVKQGDLLLKIKPDIYVSALDRMEAALNSAKSNLANAKARLLQVKAQFTQTELSFNRTKKLYDQNAISQAEYENALSSYEVSKAEVKSAEENVNSANYQVNSSEASLKEAKENLNKTTIYAPIGGTISKLNVEKGERVVGTMQMAGTEILRIANLNHMEVLVNVNENDIVNVKLGDTALIEVDAYLQDKFKGTVTEIANSAKVSGLGTDQVTNFEVKILILPQSYQKLIPKDDPLFYPFRPGMSATVDIQTQIKQNVLSVPIQAVTVRTDSTGVAVQKDNMVKEDDNGPEPEETDNNKKTKKGEEIIKEAEPREVVFIYKNNEVTMQYVKTGIQDNSYIEILEGLTDSAEIVTAPYGAISKQLKNKQKVEKVKKEDLFTDKK